MVVKIGLIAFFFLFIECFTKESINTRPVIGILVQPTDSTGNADFMKYGKYYLPASYVKWVASAGAQVVPIPYDENESVLKELFQSINGLLLPGGDVDLPGSKYQASTSYLYNLALTANDNGIFFPIWGTCQGFEQLMLITSWNNSVLESFDAEDYSIPLQFTENYSNSQIFSNLSQSLFNAFTTEPVCENLHQFGVSPEGFTLNNLQKFYTVLSINLDRNGKEFVSTIEGINYPIWATQWHPERNAFEWDPEEPINHSFAAIQSTQYLVNFFVNQARKNQHTWKRVIYDTMDSYASKYTMDVNRYYMSTYFF